MLQCSLSAIVWLLAEVAIKEITMTPSTHRTPEDEHVIDRAKLRLMNRCALHVIVAHFQSYNWCANSAAAMPECGAEAHA